MLRVSIECRVFNAKCLLFGVECSVLSVKYLLSTVGVFMVKGSRRVENCGLKGTCPVAGNAVIVS